MSNDAEMGRLSAEIDSLKSSMDAMQKIIDIQETQIRNIMDEITKIKKYEWGIAENPPTIGEF